MYTAARLVSTGRAAVFFVTLSVIAAQCQLPSFSAIRAVLTHIRAEFLLFLPNLWYICGNDTPV